MSNEVIHPPRGYTIGFFTPGATGMIGCFATEDEAREALSHAMIVAVGAPSGWHEWCGATNNDDGAFCSKPRDDGHTTEAHGWHDNGSVAWPVKAPS